MVVRLNRLRELIRFVEEPSDGEPRQVDHLTVLGRIGGKLRRSLEYVDRQQRTGRAAPRAEPRPP